MKQKARQFLNNFLKNKHSQANSRPTFNTALLALSTGFIFYDSDSFSRRFSLFNQRFLVRNECEEQQELQNQVQSQQLPFQLSGTPQKNWPTYRATDVRMHKTKETGIWVSYKDSVYDITEFLKLHPGGTEKIMLGAGGQLEAFFKFYPFHQKEHVQRLLQKYKIGLLHPDDVQQESNITFEDDETDEQLKNRSKNLLILQEYPVIAETNPKYLTDDFITPANEMYIRNHQQIPQRVDLEYFTLKVMEGKKKKAKFTLPELREKFKPHTVMSTMACSGNRRGGLKKVFPSIQGNMWNFGSIANSTYTGILMIDFLKGLGYDLEKIKDKHLVVEGMDFDVQGNFFSVSVPMKHILDPTNEVMLAYDQNEEELLLDHGFPLRFIVPGYVGVRNCKWVRKITISDEEATSPQQKENYKYITETDPSKIDYSKIEPIWSYVINSAIVYPADLENVQVRRENPYIDLKGWATGNMKDFTPVKKVQLSFDNGLTWRDAEITHKLDRDESKGEKTFTWVLWRYRLNVQRILNYDSHEPIQVQVKLKAIVRSVDSKGDTQTKPAEDQYNLRGLLNNSPHTIKFSFTQMIE